MEEVQKRVGRKDQSLWKTTTMTLLFILIGFGPFFSRAGECKKIVRQRKMELLSELFECREQILKPEKEIIDGTGKKYDLMSWNIEEILIPGRKADILEEINYSGIGQANQIPEKIVIHLEDEQWQEDKAEGYLAKKQFYNERWDEDWNFSVTFHRYDAASYRVGEKEITFNSERPELKGCEKELLSMLGWKETDGVIERYEWNGEPYSDENGTLCRDALVFGKRRIWDCKASYIANALKKGKVYVRSNICYVREEEQELKEKESTGQRKEKLDIEKVLLKYRVACLRISIGIGGLFITCLGIYFISSGLKQLKEKQDQD